MEVFRKTLSQQSRLILWISILSLFSFILISFPFYFRDKILPRVKIAGIDVSRKTKSDAEKLLKSKITPPQKIELVAGEKTFELVLSEIGFSYDYGASVNSAYLVNRSNNPLKNTINTFKSFLREVNIPLSTKVNEKEFNEYFQVISNLTTIEPVYPKVFLQGKEVVVERGSPGKKIDIETLRRKLDEQLGQKVYRIELTFKEVDPRISEEQAKKIKNRGEKLIGKKIILTNGYDSLTLEAKNLIEFLDPFKDYDQQKILSFIDREITPKVDRPPQNAVFKFQDGKVIEFVPAKDGLSVNKKLLSQEISKNLLEMETKEIDFLTIAIPTQKTSPQITTEKVNNLGIKQLLGRGKSSFVGSIPNRVHNISLASSKFNGILIAPNEIFSFNNALGDVSVFTGYKQAYIIKDGKTVLGDGGGVCQVSTTFFRAILDAGLPVIERKAHSYRVSYYEQGSPPGLDATVFAPTTDLKFKNDTPGYLLIQTSVDTKNSTLVFEIYGTSDGRNKTITKPVISSLTPPPEDLYIDDPSLPSGKIKQIDYRAWGAKVTFDYRVERNGEILFEKTFVSNYRPWQAIFLRGTGPAQ